MSVRRFQVRKARRPGGPAEGGVSGKSGKCGKLGPLDTCPGHSAARVLEAQVTGTGIWPCARAAPAGFLAPSPGSTRCDRGCLIPQCMVGNTEICEWARHSYPARTIELQPLLLPFLRKPPPRGPPRSLGRFSPFLSIAEPPPCAATSSRSLVGRKHT